MRKVTALSATYNGGLMKALKAATTSRLSCFENDTVLCAATIDPRFKLRWAHPSEKPSLTALVIRMAEAMPSNVCRHSSRSKEEPQFKRHRAEPEECGLFDFMEAVEDEPEANHTDVASQVHAYLREPCLPQTSDPLAYWRDNKTAHPHLTKLAARVLAIPASSAPVERLFSIAGNVHRPNRSLLHDATFEKLMFIRCNRHIDI